MAPKKRNPTSMKTIFAYEFIKDPQMNGTQAAIRAGYAEKNAAVTANQLKSDPYVQELIQKHMDDRAAAAGITAASVLKEIKDLAYFDISTVMNWTGNTLVVKSFDEIPPEARKMIKSIAQVDSAQGRRLELKFYDKEKMLELLGRHLVLFEKKLAGSDDDTPPPTKVEITVKDARKPTP